MAHAASCPASPRAAGKRIPTSSRTSQNAAGPYRPTGSAETTARKAGTSHDDDRPDRRHADASAQRQLGVPRHRVDAVLSKIKTHIAEILQQEGYIAGWHVEDAEDEVGKTLVLDLKYGPNRERSIAGITPRIASPACGSTRSPTNLPRVLGGLGVAIISTSSGLLTDRQAGKQGVGGEVLAYVW